MWGVVCLLGTLCLPWGRSPYPGHHQADVSVWFVPSAQYACRGGVARPLGPVARHGGVACSLGPVCPNGLSTGIRMAFVGAWLVPWFPYGYRGGVARSLDPFWPP